MNSKKTIIIVFSIIILGVVGTILIFSNNDLKDKPEVELNEGKSDEDVVLDKVTFSEITNTYDGGITTLTAKMLNNTKETKNFTVEIILKDNDGKKVKSMVQVVENLQPGRSKVLTTGIAGDYSNITKIEFEIVE